ncbi:MAG: hypothetical protein J6Z11_10030 [Candidatus Riflebacteria bacterium]|nr:hypothetical protein [Candidatus Riflebacteria bacterium]
MNNRTFKNIFGVLLTSVLLMVGCGGSSSNNPASSGNVSSGLVNVSGTVNNLSGNGRVSFYTPTAAVRNGMNGTNPFRASISNEGVYSFNTDENGNYSGQIPEGDYYVIAENSDGSMRSVSAKQTFRAVTAEIPATGSTIILTQTTDITGFLYTQGSGDGKTPMAGVPVCIEGKPFISVTDSSGYFVFNRVPVPEGETYTLKASLTESGESKTAEVSVTRSNVANIQELILKTSENNENNICAIYGKVYDNNIDPKQIQPGKLVLAILTSGQIVSTISDDENGTFILKLNKNETPVQITANPRTFYEAKVSEDLENPSFDDNEVYTFETQSAITPTPATINGIHIIETTSNGFKKSNESNLTIFYWGNDNSMIELLSERFYFPATYTVNNINKEYTHWYVLESRNYEEGTYGFRICDVEFEDNENFATVTHNKSIVISQPTITISEENCVLNSSFSEVEGGMDSKVNLDVYAVREDDPNNHIPLTLNADNVINHLDDLGEKPSGVYEIHACCTITYAGQTLKTIYADPVIYVKHTNPD